jgi:ketosteroid isomerase-like protein
VAVSRNVEIVADAYQAGPLSNSIHLAPDAEFDFTSMYPDQPVLRGIEAMRGFRDEGPWGGSIRFEPQRYFELDDQRVLVFVAATSVGRSSGAPVTTQIAHEFTLRDGLIVRVKVHRSRADARTATGLDG